jgi:hypothetical protein
MSTTETDDRRQLVLRLPPDLFARIERFTSDRGGSRHSAILYLLDLGIGNDTEIARRVDVVKARIKAKLERDLADTAV